MSEAPIDSIILSMIIIGKCISELIPMNMAFLINEKKKPFNLRTNSLITIELGKVFN
jgi:hypothetical protein